MEGALLTSPASSGVSTSTVPTLEALGQPSPGSEKALSRSRSASEQTSRPSALEGVTGEPSGRVTTASVMSDWARPVGLVSPSSWMSREKSRPVGLLAALVVGLAAIEGLKASLAQPLKPIGFGGSASSWVKIVSSKKKPGFCQELALMLVARGPWQARGTVTKGRAAMLAGQVLLPGSAQLRRSLLWTGSAGLPQTVRVEPKKRTAWDTEVTVAMMLWGGSGARVNSIVTGTPKTLKP